MNAQTNAVAQQNTSSNQFVGLLNLEAFELSQRVAKMLSSSTLVPEQYRAVTKVKAGKDNNGNWQFRDEPNPSGLSNCVERMIADAVDVIALEAEVARAIKGSESKMTLEHNQAVLVAYAQRKEILAQQDIFESTTTELNPKRYLLSDVRNWEKQCIGKKAVA